MSLISIGLLVGLGIVTGVHAQAVAPVYGQCGGTGWTGATTCATGSGCVVTNQYYSQCLPGAAVPTTTSTTPTTTTSRPATTTVPTSTASAPGSTPTSKGGKLSHVGINISGFDFGCNSDGSCNASGAWPPLLQYYGHDGQGQMTHFVNDDGFNTFRLPVGWQFLTEDAATGVLNMTNFAEYNALVNACLGTGAFCIVDVHNYARFNGQIIGQGGPTNAVFSQLWGNIAAQFASNSKIIFGVMNEPHDVPDINLWAASVQAAVTAIRKAGATSQIILLPGNNWTSAETFVSNGSGPALLTVTNPDGSVTGLVFDVHKYLDSDNSGTHPECVTNNIESSWEPLAQWLRSNNRQAFNTETGGGNTASCVEFLCQQIAYQAQNSDVFLGYVGWAAGNFDPSYVLSEVPTNTGSTWTDTLLVQSCLAPSSGSQSGSTGQ
ncbi:glycoside hydrolase family 5 protein [Hypholoma sublateritium FD-334 SS-4]|uniref:cellulase n=1 Tax=Hypholoma sublateritium (strain FD-334 SS-4) TaxID=945553 RepID=A0A0D2NC56_HYPSF|nr:glycoside hydrolase family 5 protein [Hypholoma sublateritium FD-334 SS-4]